MKLEDILSISGKPGLFKMVAQSRNGLIAESLADGRRLPVSASQQVSSLKDIAIYTHTEELPMGEVFAKMRDAAQEQPLPTKKASNEELRKYFSAVLPDYDEERVYPSHIKKVVNWYTILDEHDLLEDEDKDDQASTAADADGADSADGKADDEQKDTDA